MKRFYEEKGVRLSPLNGKIRSFDYIGFDVETIGLDNSFYMGGVCYFKDNKLIYESFFDKDIMINWFITRLNSKFFRGKKIIATNLEFDFSVLFKNSIYWNDFDFLYSGSKIIQIIEKKSDFKTKNKRGRVSFIDTMNFYPISVEKWGSILGISKLDKPKSWDKFFLHKTSDGDFIKVFEKINDNDIETFIPRVCCSEEEINELVEYNKRDCEISLKVGYFLQKSVNELGGELKLTMASSSMDIFRRKFLTRDLYKETYLLKDSSIRSLIFDGYYGGRTEVFKRGEYENIFYYDINSLYPSVMCKEYPLPQSVRKGNKSIDFITNYMGVSKVVVYCPSSINKPLLPLRISGKLIFPVGTFKGVYNHCELSKAIYLGYKILRIEEQIIYTESFFPFKNFVSTMYNLRKEYKNQGSQMEKVVKLVMNSLYGKFGMRKTVKNIMMDMIKNPPSIDWIKENCLEGFEIKKDMLLYQKTVEYNGKFSFPILASYTTSYARLKMYDFIKNDDSVCYMDTDSIFTLEDKGFNSDKIGEMKLEGFFEKAIFVKPKFYLLEGEDNYIKIKGLNRANVNDFRNILIGGNVDKMKFTRLKEGNKLLNYNVNQIRIISKKFSLDDTKRFWLNDWGLNSNSLPLEVFEID